MNERREMAQAEAVRAIMEAYPDRWEDIVSALNEPYISLTISADEVELPPTNTLGTLYSWPDWIRVKDTNFCFKREKIPDPQLKKAIARAKKWLGMK